MCLAIEHALRHLVAVLSNYAPMTLPPRVPAWLQNQPKQDFRWNLPVFPWLP